MRANWTTNLSQRLRRADPEAHIIVEAVVVSNEDTKSCYTDWDIADDTTNFSLPLDGSIELLAANTIHIDSTVQDSVHTNLTKLQPGGTGPWFAAKVEWSEALPDDLELRRVLIDLDAEEDGGVTRDVGAWVCELFNVMYVDQGEGGSGDLLSFGHIGAEVRVTVDATATAQVTFDWTSLTDRPRPKIQRPIGGGTDYPEPITYAVVHALTSAGAVATNAGMIYDSSTASVAIGNSILSGVSLTEGINNDPPVPGTFLDAEGPGVPSIAFETATFATATLSFTTAANQFDMGAVPTGDVEFICEGLEGSGSLAYQVRTTTANDWITVTDGDIASEVGVTNWNNQTYEGEVIFTPGGSGDTTPKLRAFGMREVTTKSLANIAEVQEASWSVDPVSLKGEIPECVISAIRDGEQDYADAITELLSTYDIADITFRIWVGHPDLDRQYWMLIDSYLIDDYRCEAGRIEIVGLSPLALCKAQLPKYDITENTRTALQYVTASSWTMKTAYEDLRDTQIEVPGRWVGPSVEDTTEVAKIINQRSEGKDEMDAIAFLAGGAITSKQGRLAFTDIYGPKAVVAVFPTEEIAPSFVTPGFANRIPEMVVEYGWSEDERRYENVLRRTHAGALAKLGIARLEAPKHVDDVAARWINGTNAEQIASNVGRRWVDGFGTGMVQLGFRSNYAHPELEIGDMVALETESFAAVDPNTSNAVKGRLWVAGVIVEVGDVLGKSFVIWVRSYADILSAPTSGTITVGRFRFYGEVYHSTTQSLAVNETKNMSFDSETEDVGDIHDTSTNTERLTVPDTGGGRWDIHAQIPWSDVDFDPARAVIWQFQKNGATVIAAGEVFKDTDAADGETTIGGSFNLEAGDYVVLRLGSNPAAGGTGTATIGDGTSAGLRFWARRTGF